MYSRASRSKELSSQPAPELFLSGNHSKASKPFSTAYSKGRSRVGADRALWFPIRRAGVSGILNSVLGARLNDEILAFRIGALDVLGGRIALLNGGADFCNSDQ